MQEQLRNVGIPEQYIQSKYKQVAIENPNNDYAQQPTAVNPKQRPKSSTLHRVHPRPFTVDNNKLSDSVQRIANQPILVQHIGQSYL